MTYDNNSDIALYRFVQYVSTYNRYMVNLMVDFGRSAIIYENMNAAQPMTPSFIEINQLYNVHNVLTTVGNYKVAQLTDGCTFA